MAKRKVRHGLIHYRVENRRELAFRGQTVDLDEDDLDRLERVGAVVPTDEDLARPGTLRELSTAASDEEIRTWASDATEAELRETAELRPELRDRLMAAYAEVREDLDHQALSQRGTQRDENESEDEDEDEDDSTSVEVGPDAVVRGTANEISAYLADHPDQANEVLMAEGRLAEEQGRDVRKGVETACQTAASYA